MKKNKAEIKSLRAEAKKSLKEILDKLVLKLKLENKIEYLVV